MLTTTVIYHLFCQGICRGKNAGVSDTLNSKGTGIRRGVHEKGKGVCANELIAFIILEFIFSQIH